MPADKARLYELLEQQRQIVVAPDMGEKRREDGWYMVDFLLDRLIELNALPEVTYEQS